MKKISYAVFSVILIILTSLCFSNTQSSLESKLALENSLEKRIKMVLSEALGTEDIIIIISADLQEQEKKSAVDIMPGIPEKEKMGELSISSSLTMVKKISANLILDKGLSESDAALARKLTANLLGLQPERQDLVTMERMDFRKAKPSGIRDLFIPANLLSLAWIIVGIIAIALLTAFLTPLAKSISAMAAAFIASNSPSAAKNEALSIERELKKIEKPAAETHIPLASDGRQAPFFFLAAANFNNLCFIMKNRSVEDLTILLNYAPKELASKLAEALYPKSLEALKALPSVTILSAAKVRNLEAELMTALDYVIGGEEKTADILSGLEEKFQTTTMEAFNNLSPEMSGRISANVAKLSFLQIIEPAQAQALARRVPMRALAAALKSVSYAEEFKAKLSDGMRERLNQEMEMMKPGETQSFKNDRAKVVEVLGHMLREGLISAPNPTATEPPPPPPTATQPAADSAAIGESAANGTDSNPAPSSQIGA